MRGIWFKSLNFLSFVIFGCGLSCSSSIIDFVDWLGLGWGLVVFCCLSLFFMALLGTFFILPIYSRMLLVFLFYNILLFTHQKNVLCNLVHLFLSCYIYCLPIKKKKEKKS